jgi:hypothetical protein
VTVRLSIVVLRERRDLRILAETIGPQVRSWDKDAFYDKRYRDLSVGCEILDRFLAERDIRGLCPGTNEIVRR